MATTAAILQVLVEANTAGATAELRRFDSALQRTDKTTATATTRTSALGSATRTTGSHLASAARYAAGAAAAYLSISQAKAAITTTQDLAKTTAGLNRNLGLTVKSASQWAAVAKSRDVDSKSLTMSLTTLSRRLVDTNAALKEGGSAADTAFAPFQRLGISQAEVAKGSKDISSFLPVLADGFGDAAGGAERQASAQQLLGRGYQTILPLFASGAKGLQEQQEWADKYGATLNNTTLKAQMDLVQAQRESKVAVLGLQVSFAQFLTPALEKANAVFQRIAKIVGSDDLTSAEKFEKVGKIIGKWGDKAYQAFVQILPKMVTATSERAPEIAGALVRGFLNAPVLGKLVLGAWFLKALGGASVLRGVGMSIGQRIAAPMATTIAADVAAPGMGWGKAGAIAGRLMGAAGAVGFLAVYKDEILDALGQESGDEFWNSPLENIKEVFGGDDRTFDTFGKLEDSLDGVRKHSKMFADGFKDDSTDSKRYLDNLSDAFKDHAKDADKSLDKVTSSGGAMEKALGRSLGAVGGDLGRFSADTSRETGRSAESFANLRSKAGDSLAKVGASAQNAAKTTGAGMQNIGDNVNSILKGLKVGLLKFTIKQVTQTAKNATAGLQGGGMVPGTQTGDVVPLHIGGQLAAMVEPGEYVSVANRKATAALMKANDAVPRFKDGGVVGGGLSAAIALTNKYEAASYPYLWGGGHSGFVNAGSPVDCSGFVSDVLHAAGLLDGAPMVSGALMNWGQPAKGNEPLVVYANPGHTVMSLNGKVAGTSGSNPGGGAGWIEGGDGASLAPGAKRTMDVGVAMAREIKRVLLEGPDGPFKMSGQKALDTVRNAANKFVSSQFPMGTGGGGDPGSGKASTYTASWYGPTPATTGAAGVNLIGTNSFAELSDPPGSLNFSALGGLPYHEKIAVTYGGKTITPEKLDVGAGGPGLNGHIRAIDLWQDAAKLLPGFMSAGIADVEVARMARGGSLKPPIKFAPNLLYPDGVPPMFGIKGSHLGPEIKKALKFRDDLAKQMSAITRLDESIDVYDRIANMDDDFSMAEMVGEMQMLQALYGSLQGASATAKGGQRALKKPLMLAKGKEKQKLLGLSGGFSSALEELTGVTGNSGRILDTYLDIVALSRQMGETATPETPAALSVAGLMEFAKAVRYGVMDSALPKAHNGMFFNAPPSVERPVMIRGQEAVVPMDGPAQGGGEWVITIDNWEEGTGRIRRIADNQIGAANRTSQNRQRAGVIG